MKTLINRDFLKSIINESIESMIFESARSQMNFGVKGNIPVEPSSTLCDDVNPEVLALIDRGDKSIPRRSVGDPKYFGGTKVWDAYTKYSNAITRRSDLGRSAVSFFIFLKKIRSGWKGAPLQVYEKDGSYLIGTMRGGVFLCIYLCPNNVGIGMFKFIKEVCEYDNVVFAVTDDMADMLERLGCPKYDNAVNAKFRGQMHEKMVYGSTKEAAIKGAKLLNLMSKSGELGATVKDAILQNPKLKELYDKNPNIVFDLMNEPIITQCLMNNPQLVDFINANPNILSQMAVDPVKGFLSFLLGYRKSMSATSTVNEVNNKEEE